MTAPAQLDPHPDKKITGPLALLVSDVINLQVASSLSGQPEEVLLTALKTPGIQTAVDVEVTRLRLSGELAMLKAAHLTDSMLTKLLAAPIEEISIGLAAKLAELGMKFKEKSASELPTGSKTQIIIVRPGDPEPPKDVDGYRIVIRLDSHQANGKKLGTAGVIDAE